MSVRDAQASWHGNLKAGKGEVAFDGMQARYSFPSRFEDGEGSSPEAMIAAAHASCYSMALANMLSEAGHTPDAIHTHAAVHLSMEGGPHISKIVLEVKGEVPGLDADTFQEHAEKAKRECPISKALAVIESIELKAELAS